MSLVLLLHSVSGQLSTKDTKTDYGTSGRLVGAS